MKKFLIILSALVAACSGPSVKEKKDYNRGWEFEWTNTFTQEVVLNSSDTGKDDTWNSVKKFNTGAKYGIANVWGRGNEAEGIYMDEYLPAFFTRRLELKEFSPADGDLSWMFTGDKGGITVIIDSGVIVLSPRYSNSMALNELNTGKMIMRRHGDREIVRSDVKYTGRLESVVVEMTSNQQIRLYVNGTRIAEQLCMQDLTQHQLRYSGKLGNISGELFSPAADTVEVSVNPEKTHQEIIGFGGIASIPAYYQLSEEGKELWWKYLKEYNLLIQREYPNGSKLNESCSNFDSISQATAHYYGDNFQNGEISDFSYNKKIFEMGGMDIFEFWQLPHWAMKDKTPLYDRYAEAMVNYCKQSVAKSGKAPEIVGIQNEVEQPDTVWQQMTLALRAALDKNGFQDIKIHMHNNSYLHASNVNGDIEMTGGLRAAKAFTAIPEVWKAIDFSASNLYDYQGYKMNVDAYDTVIEKWNALTRGKPFISTELCQNDNLLQEQSYKTAFFMGQLYHKNMVMMDASIIMYCWLINKTVQPSYQTSRCLFAVDMKNNFVPVPSSFQLRVFCSYTRHLPKGMKRVDALSNDKDLLVSAYGNEKQKTLIIPNRSMTEKNVSIDWKGVGFEKAELTSQYCPNKPVCVEDEIVLKPGEILTLFQ